MTTRIYEASVYTRQVTYKNFKGKDRTVELHFALDPLKLMALVAGFTPKKSKSGDPSKRNQPAPISDEQQLEFVQKLAAEAAGLPSDDGESWLPFEGFRDSLAGKAFLTKLASSDGDRREFAEKVILNPFRAFVSYAKEDDTNTDADKQQFDLMVKQMERIFAVPEAGEETLEQKRARLAAEMAMLEASAAPQMPDEN